MPTIDYEKRRKVMKRSRELGHCICEPRRPCPCDVFTDHGLCPCAGERPDPIDLSQVKLTEMVKNAGCASKIAPGDLEAVLSRLPEVNDPAVISGLPASDDAGLYQIAEGVCLVQTVDVMTPCVDDPRQFGRICAVNCVSDIYAMGGAPRTAVSVLAFPSETLSGQVMYEMMAGAMEALAEAGVALIGGHSVKDEQIKLGFAITGTIDPEKQASHERAQVGDVLVLTKPLGTGVLSFAHQIGRTHEVGMEQAQAAMAQLNRGPAEALGEVGATAATDVTGFGLFGHLVSMARHSNVTAEVYADALPAFDGVLGLLDQNVIPGAVERNSEYVGSDIAVDDGVDPARLHLGFDAQTSGGLLIAVPEERLAALLAALEARGDHGWVIGRVSGKSDGRIHLVREAGEKTVDLPAETEADPFDIPAEPAEQPGSSHEPGCCADVFGEPASQGDAVSEARRAFGGLMRAAGQAGAIDAKGKELIHFALVLLSRCEPCLEAHIARARKMGISQAELDEAAWCAISMGGAPVKMFYEAGLTRYQSSAADGGVCC
ncbi:MAG: selenide, water dikinase SelD [Phycisphaeraceae bacterium]